MFFRGSIWLKNVDIIPSNISSAKRISNCSIIRTRLLWNTLGFPFFTHCTRANVSDDAGLIEMLTLNINYFKSKPVNIPKITILLDGGKLAKLSSGAIYLKTFAP
jgi:hypothetical protein